LKLNTEGAPVVIRDLVDESIKEVEDEAAMNCAKHGEMAIENC